jgi:hypothetical protein
METILAVSSVRVGYFWGKVEMEGRKGQGGGEQVKEILEG